LRLLMSKRPDRDHAGKRAGALGRWARGVAGSLAGRRNTRRRQALQLVQNSGLFDREWYLRAYPDVARARIDPLQHYMDSGWSEGRDPGPDFAASSYLKANPDVAAAGANPLLHFLEFGQSEGRGPTTHRPAPKRPSAPTAFGAAAPCVSFPLPDEPRARWVRSYRLRQGPELFRAGEWPAGYVSDPAFRARLNSDFALLASLSGYAAAIPGESEGGLPQSTEALADAWFVNSAQLRTRWRGCDFPVAVRGFQHDPLCEGELCLVGEGLATSPLDTVDLHLRNPLFPVLIAFAAAEGAVRGTRMLAFPSLCRGGLHYPELLHSGETAEADRDPLALGEVLAARLLLLRNDGVSPAIARIEVDISAADARGPLFQPNVQQWLSNLFNIGVTGAGSVDPQTADYLADAVSVRSSAGEPRGEATLRIGRDMAPTIAALVEPHRTGAGHAEQSFAPLIISARDPSQPAIAIHLPSEDGPAQDLLSGRAAACWPRVRGSAKIALPEGFPAAAIAQSAGGQMSDSTLFVPISDRPEQSKPRPAVTWLVDARGWAEGALAQAVHALSQQTGGGGDCLFFLGAPDAAAALAARSKFAASSISFDDVDSAVAAAGTPLIGFIGSGVLLHDNRSAAILAALLEKDSVATASCAVVHPKQQSAGGHASLEDGGSFGSSSSNGLGRSERHAAIAFLWGSNYPVTAPGRHLWLAHKATLTDWSKNETRRLGKRFHIFSSEVSASHLGTESPVRVPAFVPRAAAERVTRVRALFG
jgi:hypothetical protein